MSSGQRGRPKGTGKKPDKEYLNAVLTREHKEKLRKYAEQKGITITQAIELFIEELEIEPES